MKTKPVTVKVGSVVLKIYPLADRNRYCVVYRVGGVRHRAVRSTLESAKNFALKTAKRIDAQQANRPRLSAAEEEMFFSAVKALEPFSIPLNAAIADYVSARRKIGTRSLSDAVNHFVHSACLNLPRKTLPEVTQEMLDAKKTDGVSTRYRLELAYSLAKACSVLTKAISEISTTDIDDYLRGRGISSRSRYNERAALVTVFEFAKSRNYLPRDRATAAELSVRVKVRTGEIQIFTPQEMEALLAAAEKRAVPLLALGAFAGLRTAEIARLEWNDINFVQGIITVSAAKAKTASRRIVPIQPNLAAWLSPWAKASGLVLEKRATELEWSAVELANQQSGGDPIEWKRNGLRHSYGSYRMAQIKNAAEVALEMGNSPQMIFQHYRELVTPQDAAAWWSILPKHSLRGMPIVLPRN